MRATGAALLLALVIGLHSRAIAAASSIPAPVDRPYPGELQVSVDATDIVRKVVHVHETIRGPGGDTVLYFPRWIPGEHGPTGPITRLAGLRISANGQRVAWTRDLLDVHAFHVAAPRGVKTLEVDFDYLSPINRRAGDAEFSENVLVLEWNRLLLYPAGFYARQIPVTPSVSLPAGWKFATALEPATASGSAAAPGGGTGDAGALHFKRTSVEQLIDSPLMAGRHSARFDLDPGAKLPVYLHLFAEDPEQLVVRPEQLAMFRSLLQQGYRLFGAPHFAHYDLLLALSDQIGFSTGLEHQQSQVLSLHPDWFVKWEDTGARKDDPAHELAHSWNGKFRRPADLWTPNFNVPMQDDLLWLYEGQTQYWGQVLTARAGLWSQAQAFDRMARAAAYLETQSGRQWRPLQDTTADPITAMRQPLSWPDWQRSEDYYEEGGFIWLEADALIRERSGGQRSLDDFARAFFGARAGDTGIHTYGFADIVSALNDVQPYDWATFLRERLDALAPPTPRAALRAAGHELVFTDQAGAFQDKSDAQYKRDSFYYSLGLVIAREDAAITSVAWGGPAFKADITPGSTLVAVNGEAYKGDVLRKAITAAKGTAAPIELIVKNGDRYRVVKLDYHGGLRYPHLQRIEQSPARLDEILKAR